MRAHTAGPWVWWTSNSWRRLRAEDPATGRSKNVLEPTTQNDGHPDVIVSEDDMGLIGAAPDLLTALESLLNCVDGVHEPDQLERCKTTALAAITKAKTRVER